MTRANRKHKAKSAKHWRPSFQTKLFREYDANEEIPPHIWESGRKYILCFSSRQGDQMHCQFKLESMNAKG